MNLSPPVRAAVLEVVRRLRDPTREPLVGSVGFMILDAMPPADIHSKHAVLEALRLSLGLSPVPGSLARWAHGKPREEVAKGLERVATS